VPCADENDRVDHHGNHGEYSREVGVATLSAVNACSDRAGWGTTGTRYEANGIPDGQLSRAVGAPNASGVRVSNDRAGRSDLAFGV